MKHRQDRGPSDADATPGSSERRLLLQGAAALLATGTALTAGSAGVSGSAGNAASAKAHTARPDSVAALDGRAVVQTGCGAVAGYIREGIYTYKGIPYAGTTEGDHRFAPPAKALSWTGVRSCRQYGHVAPQSARTGWANDEEAFMFTWDDGIPGEDCLRVNIWTPGINDGKKRPVMVWLHGGGFTAGSGQELRSYDGENLARRGDVVVVSLNHRLNALGFLDLSQFGERYQTSANVGMLDIVAALEWVRDNIAGFGGDATRVTIFGQSGGGGKVGALMGMPSAKGLFHRAIVESGSMLRFGTSERAQSVSELVVAELGLSRATIDQIHTLPYARIVEAGAKVLRDRNPRPPGAVPDFRRLADQLGFSPVVDGSVLPAQPFDPKTSALSAEVPMIIGTTLNEFMTALNHPEYEAMNAGELEQRVKAMFGDNAQGIIQAFQKRTPNAKPFDVWSRIAASPVRQSAIKQAAAKTALAAAPAYLYWFTWQTPILNGRPRAFHCAEIPFVFDNTDRCETMTGGGSEARALGAKMSDAWIVFARSGNPNHSGIPHWPQFSVQNVPTMIFDSTVSLVNDPDGEEQRSIS
jgi:para-nitrobenzyl esterase